MSYRCPFRGRSIKDTFLSIRRSKATQVTVLKVIQCHDLFLGIFYPIEILTTGHSPERRYYFVSWYLEINYSGDQVQNCLKSCRLMCLCEILSFVTEQQLCRSEGVALLACLFIPQPARDHCNPDFISGK